MSDTNEDATGVEIGGEIEIASMDDVRRTLEALQKRVPNLEKELATERARRQSVETNYQNERAARTTAETERDGHAARVVSEAEARWTAEKEAAQAAIAARESELESAEEEYARCAELGNWAEAAKAQRKMAEETAKLERHRERLQILETNKDRLIPKMPAVVERSAQPEPSGHRYQHLIKGELVGGEEAWLDQRPQFQNDRNYQQRVFNASAIAVQNFTRGSEPYFREIERILGENASSDRKDTTTRNDDVPKRRDSEREMSADLPASRRSAPGQEPAGAQRQVRLTPDEVDIADGLYGNPNDTDWYIANPAERYRKYHENKQRMASRG